MVQAQRVYNPLSSAALKVVFDDDFRKAFIDAPNDFQEQYGLTTEEMEMLTAYSPEKIMFLANQLSEVDANLVIAAAWCNMTTPVRE